eukprot:CAMPEP_0172771920 /NCGR_PEP_ID=MMETSP1074-20121228/191452_1 /TAXON_ID=2916 /ORGANISM="Ceratium fusus, Strain PA161109" /LENGTH=47 /DNA_ID= /DNA_START= /DNA_END= /DNA_ORIENTATION=
MDGGRCGEVVRTGDGEACRGGDGRRGVCSVMVLAIARRVSPAADMLS